MSDIYNQLRPVVAAFDTRANLPLQMNEFYIL